MTTNLSESPLNLLQETKSSIESIISKLLSTKQNKNSNNKSETRELLTQMFLNFINLRQANRDILLQEEKSKSNSPIDFTTLQLQNLVYEKNHYLKANKSYKDFESKYQNIDLISEQEFNSQTLSNDDNNTSHDLMLKRLNFELHQSAKLILGNEHAFDERRTSRPYKWAQHLAGIEILPEMSPFLTDKDTHTAKGYGSASDQHNVQSVLQRIRSQKKAKLTLI